MSDQPIRSSSPDERRAILALTLVPDVGRIAYDNLIATFCDATHALRAGVPPTLANDALARADQLIARAAARGLELVTEIDADYPNSLRDLGDPPAVLWSRGSWATLQEPVVAVVGTRHATSYGLRMTREIVAALARAGATIVSGMALGIDAVAHKATLDVDGRTVAVLGTGADVAYPRAHVALHREIGARGLVVSELAPGARSHGGSFPMRNRIIAALARLTIVVEAPLPSGALITARRALDLGRDVAAVPGPIDSPQSQGTNEYIRDGAHPITSVADALTLVGLSVPARSAPALNDEIEGRIWGALASGAATLDELCARAALPVTQCLTAITRLELRGVVECALTGEIRRR
ncbi:MAG TPA: DNA-processing protein DprA [Gemmatimonadaceae bacterium]